VAPLGISATKRRKGGRKGERKGRRKGERKGRRKGRSWIQV
jgi:hypothetical protein